jgi:hypothetical protein
MNTIEGIRSRLGRKRGVGLKGARSTLGRQGSPGRGEGRREEEERDNVVDDWSVLCTFLAMIGVYYGLARRFAFNKRGWVIPPGDNRLQ